MTREAVILDYFVTPALFEIGARIAS